MVVQEAATLPTKMGRATRFRLRLHILLCSCLLLSPLLLSLHAALLLHEGAGARAGAVSYDFQGFLWEPLEPLKMEEEPLESFRWSKADSAALPVVTFVPDPNVCLEEGSGGTGGEEERGEERRGRERGGEEEWRGERKQELRDFESHLFSEWRQAEGQLRLQSHPQDLSTAG
eukprot:4851-Hanusia_phi.AAC.1